MDSGLFVLFVCLPLVATDFITYYTLDDGNGVGRKFDGVADCRGIQRAGSDVVKRETRQRDRRNVKCTTDFYFQNERLNTLVRGRVNGGP